MELLLATRNRNKVVEMQHALDGTGWQVVMLSDIAGAPDVEEDGATFQENALKKARSAARVSRLWTLAEDSGLEIDALGGEPGVKSSRYAGEGASDTDRIRKVLTQLTSVPDERRTARFRCVMCLIDPAGNENCFEGRCEGRIADSPRGSSGFGYDPIFIPDVYDKTFAELGLGVKGNISHRARAMQQVIDYLRRTKGIEGSRDRVSDGRTV
jgi:XTP/dITP diphosphohydrolase